MFGCVGLDDGRSSPIYRAEASGTGYWIRVPGTIDASSCAMPPREIKGGDGLLRIGATGFCFASEAVEL
jgi:hypothetical protein